MKNEKGRGALTGAGDDGVHLGEVGLVGLHRNVLHRLLCEACDLSQNLAEH